MTQTVLLTGATGYLGGHVVEAFVSVGWSVHALSRPPLSRVPSHAVAHELEPGLGNLRDIVQTARPAVVVHLAAVSRGGETPAELDQQVEANIRLPAHLLAAMRAAGVRRFVNCGTSWQNSTGDGYSPFNFYAATKQACEDIALSFCVDGGLAAISLRLFDTYGPSDTRNKIVDLLFRCAAGGSPLAMSPGEQRIDLVHVRDVAAAFVTAARRTATMQEGDFQAYGISSEDPRPLREVAALVGRVAGRAPAIAWGARAYRPREIMAPWSTFQRLPDWRARIALEDGLREIWASWPRPPLTPGQMHQDGAEIALATNEATR